MHSHGNVIAINGQLETMLVDVIDEDGMIFISMHCLSIISIRCLFWFWQVIRMEASCADHKPRDTDGFVKEIRSGALLLMV